MKIGLFTALLANLSLDEVIQKVKPLGIRTLELGAGNFPASRTLNSNGWTSLPNSKNLSKSSTMRESRLAQ